MNIRAMTQCLADMRNFASAILTSCCLRETNRQSPEKAACVSYFLPDCTYKENSAIYWMKNWFMSWSHKFKSIDSNHHFIIKCLNQLKWHTKFSTIFSIHTLTSWSVPVASNPIWVSSHFLLLWMHHPPFAAGSRLFRLIANNYTGSGHSD